MTQDGGWSGFSDEDLKRLKGSSDGPVRGGGNRRGGPGARRGSRGASNSQPPRIEPLRPNQMLSKPQIPTTDAHTDINRRPSVKSSQHSTDASDIARTPNNDRLNDVPSEGKVTNARKESGDKSTSLPANNDASNLSTKIEQEVITLELDESQIVSMEMANMSKFREQQKMMEELNKKKKAMLTSAIQERQKKAKSEAVKLTRIKQELDKLDQMVVSEISVMRNRIEEASREYTDAQSGFDYYCVILQDPEFSAPPGCTERCIGGTKKYRPSVGDFLKHYHEEPPPISRSINRKITRRINRSSRNRRNHLRFNRSINRRISDSASENQVIINRKRYDRAEKEFIESKIDLHKKEEMKDQLTEHLYTVIHQNELRKAKKLSDLMDKLEMEDSGLESPEIVDMQIPRVCLISPVEKRKGCLQSIIDPEGTEGNKEGEGGALEPASMGDKGGEPATTTTPADDKVNNVQNTSDGSSLSNEVKADLSRTESITSSDNNEQIAVQDSNGNVAEMSSVLQQVKETESVPPVSAEEIK